MSNNKTGPRLIPISIFIKLLGIVLLVGLGINGAIYLGIRQISDPSSDGHRLLATAISQCFEQLARSAGLPPDPVKRMALSKERGLDIRVDSPTCLIRTRPAHTGQDPFVIPLVLLAVCAMIAIAYAAIWSLLKPLRELTLGVKSFAIGDFAYRVQVRKPDELGQLAHAFNDMCEKIQGMLVAKEQLLIDVSHEFQSPLTRMKVVIALLNDEDKKIHLERAVAEMEAMVSEILESARLNCVSRDFVPVETELVSFIHELLENYRKEAIRISFTAQSASVLVWVDPPRIVTLLRNLIDNALKYSSVLVSNVEMTLTSDAHSVEISLRDYGIGIPEAELGYIFEPFYRVNKFRNNHIGGFGLGLSLCQRIVHAHGGRIEVISHKQMLGTKVTVFLPKNSMS